MDQQTVRVDGIGWWAYYSQAGHRLIQPLCVRHGLRLYPLKSFSGQHDSNVTKLSCVECDKSYSLPRPYAEEKTYVLDKIDSRKFKSMKFINLDDEAIPIAEDKVKSKDGKYFVTALLTESKIGKRLVVYAGERGAKDKTQIFIEPNIRRLAFDQTNLHPSEVFAALEAVFRDGTKASIEAQKSGTE